MTTIYLAILAQAYKARFPSDHVTADTVHSAFDIPVTEKVLLNVFLSLLKIIFSLY